ncbi:hypothetical protein BHC46_01265 [Snodgrassella alvi]|jgi:hypothetical protein|uniref:Uncharacterized protein n=1 Tax=Snodgrassella alvi TaxID=1196083 RepID=A0A2N9XNL3_9NEIS|nr:MULTISPECIES: hypothetical protein [Snodgrassella]PIT49918.1 hypothetical protein BHC46_01265 [Snodgrassella alvi]
MTLVTLYKTTLNEKTPDIVLYRAIAENNTSYLEREDENEKFNKLWNVDDCSPTTFKSAEDIILLMKDIEIVLDEARKNNDIKICNHLKEIFVLCKICLWNINLFYLVFSPWGGPAEMYPYVIPKKYRFNISDIDD